MINSLRSLFLAALLSATTLGCASAQTPNTAETKEAAYKRTITERAAKIVGKIEGLKARDSVQVRDLIADQYLNLNTIYDQQKARKAALKAQPQTEATKAELAKVDADTEAALARLHPQYLKQLSRRLTPTQIDQVKGRHDLWCATPHHGCLQRHAA